MPKISWAALRAKRNLDNNPEELFGPLITGLNHDGTPFGLQTEPLDTALLALQQGQVWAVGAQLALGASQVGEVLLANPSTSGVNVLIRAHTIFCDQSTMAVTYLNDSTASTGTLITPFNANQAYEGSGLVSKVEARYGVGIAVGGNVLNARSRVASAAPVDLDWAFLLPPGQSFGIRVTAPSGLGATATVEANAIWMETPV